MPYPIAAVRGFATRAAAVPSAIYANLVSWWSMDEASDGSGAITRQDSHGTNHLTDNNTTPSATGLVGNAADLESTNNEYLSVLSNSTLQACNGDFALCGWIKLESFATSYANIFDKGGEYELGSQFNSNAKPYFLVGGGQYVQYAGTALSLATWYFIAAWYDVSDKLISLQVNNGTVYTQTHTGSYTTNTNPLWFGRLANGANKHDGLLDEWAYWKGYYPSAAERAWLYNAGAGRSYAAFVAQYGG